MRLHPQRLRLHPPGLLPRFHGIHLPAAPQVHIASLVALAPAGHLVAIGPGALAGLLDHLNLPYHLVLLPGLELEGLGLCQGSLLAQGSHTPSRPSRLRGATEDPLRWTMRAMQTASALSSSKVSAT